MEIREIDEVSFDRYARTHILKNFYQTSAYGTVMKKYGYTPLYIAGYDNGEIVCASLILTKKLSATMKYGYAPRGFLLKSYDERSFREIQESLEND